MCRAHTFAELAHIHIKSFLLSAQSFSTIIISKRMTIKTENL
nr:MAG TPA: hypothetical protein [Caudoviricetes sp.]